jgi:DNA-binding transcriptional regulator YdaS (Cro superfamily)
VKEMRMDIVRFFGSKSKLALALGVERSAVTQWIRRNAIPATRAVQIEQLSCGRFKALEVMAYWPE